MNLSLKAAANRARPRNRMSPLVAALRQPTLPDIWWRLKHPHLTVRQVDHQNHPPTIFYLTPDFRLPAGGLKVMYDHVDGLNELGYRARVLHERAGFRFDWFANETSVTDVGSVALGPLDVLVVTELNLDVVAGLRLPCRVVVLNQSAHLTWTAHPDDVRREMETNTDIVGVIGVSRHSVEYLTYAFPRLAVHRVRNVVDAAVFHPEPAGAGGHGEKRILRVSRRGASDTAQVLGILSARGVLDGWVVTEAGGRSDHEGFAAQLRSARIVLVASTQEGFGLPAAEAMCSGAYVVGYDGFGGREFFRPEFCAPVPACDVVAFAKALEAAIVNEGREPGWCATRGREAARFIGEHYSRDGQLADLEACYSALSPDLRPMPEEPR